MVKLLLSLSLSLARSLSLSLSLSLSFSLYFCPLFVLYSIATAAVSIEFCSLLQAYTMTTTRKRLIDKENVMYCEIALICWQRTHGRLAGLHTYTASDQYTTRTQFAICTLIVT